MQKKGIVKNVQSTGTWDGKFGTMYKFEVTIGDDTGEYSSKSKDQTKFVIGQEAEYTFTDGNYPKIKPVFTQSFGGGFNKSENPERQKMIVKQSSLKVAVDLCIANKKTDLNSVFELADKVVSWVMDDNAGQPVDDGYTSVKKQQPSKSDDLPF
jgi:hypothetical protein